MLNWRFMNFSVMVRATTVLRQVTVLIEQHHGRAEEIRLFMSPPSLKSEITNLNTRISDMGFKV
jgi:hypothetical protein